MICCENGKIFVFGSNLAGRHGAGAALHAVRCHGAVYGQGWGPQGNSYAIPTKDEHIKTMPLKSIQNFVNMFLVFAHCNPDKQFYVTALGTGLAGYSHEDMAPLFAEAPSNCELPKEWIK